MKKTLFILGFILFFLVVLTLLLSNLLMRKQYEPVIAPSETISTSPKTTLITPYPTITNFSSYQSPDFEINYSPQQGKYLIIKKSAQANVKINQWLKENHLENKITADNSTFIENLPQGGHISQITPGLNPTDSPTHLLVDLINTLFFMNVNVSSSPGSITPSKILSPTTKPKKNPASTPQPQSSGLIYYPQCSGDFDNYPLPGGCTICQAGCGSTTAAMILASYVDKNYDPENVANLYGKNGYSLGCGGSGYSEPKSLFESMGLKTSDYILADNDGVTIDQAADDFKKYLNAGWTLFTLARFNAGGHYFWIVDMDSNNNVLAYDPYYGRLTIPPFNENQYYPNPKYRVVFGVKK